MSQQLVTDWWTKVPITPIVPRRNYVVLPIFNIVNPAWKGASEIVQQYNFSASSNFYLTGRPAKPSGVNYGLCIRYRSNGIVYRYKLWEDNSFVLNNVPLYNKDLIKANFVLEIWTFNGAANSSQTTAIDLWSSVRTVPSDFTVDTDIPLAYSALASYADLQSAVLAPAIPAGIVFNWQADFGYSIGLQQWTDQINAVVLSSSGVIPPGFNIADANYNNKASLTLSGTPRATLSTAGAVAEFKHVFAVLEFADDSGNYQLLQMPMCQIQSDPGNKSVRVWDNFEGQYTVTTPITESKMLVVEYARRYTTPTAETRIYKITQEGFTLAENSTLVTLGNNGPDVVIIHSGNCTAKIAALFCFTAALSDVNRAAMHAYIDSYYRGAILSFPLTFNANSAWLDNP